MWLREIGNKYHRYKLEGNWPYMVLDKDGHEQLSVQLSKWWEDNEGNWKVYASGQFTYIVPVSVLVQRFIAEDSPNDKYITDLETFKKDAFERAISEQSGGFDELFSIYKDKPVVQISREYVNPDNSAEKTANELNEPKDEIDQKNIHTLYGRKSEVEPGIAPE